MVNNYFNSDYTNYWKNSVKKSVDGTIIAGPNEVEKIFKILNLKKFNNILDLGCSYGRMIEPLKKIGKKIHGCDIDPSAILEASNKNYTSLNVTSSDDLKYKSDFFDFIFCWAVFDVLDHTNTLIAVNNILKKNGFFLLTAKNANYRKDDDLAFIAEKNASKKNFPNQFINLKEFLKNLKFYGFNAEAVFLFSKRGDLGLLKYNAVLDLNNFNDESYEFLILLKKISKISNNYKNEFTLNYSNTAYKIAFDNGFTDLSQFFLKD